MGTMLRGLGINTRQFRRGMRELPAFIRDYWQLRGSLKSLGNEFPLAKWNPCLTDRSDCNGVASGHYFHQDLFVARQIYQRQPSLHVDVGSRVDGFVAHVAVFRPIEVLDIRPQESHIPNITFKQADITSDTFELESYCDSLSCLHAIEHFGLGRYGDPIDARGHQRGLANMHRCLKPGGLLYLSTPIGPQRIEFNAHRVFSIRYLLEWLEPLFELQAFSYVDDAGNLHPHCALSPELIDSNCGCRYGCGIFELRKRP
jgi:SAM-dependent methyltransferase